MANPWKSDEFLHVEMKGCRKMAFYSWNLIKTLQGKYFHFGKTLADIISVIEIFTDKILAREQMGSTEVICDLEALMKLRKNVNYKTVLEVLGGWCFIEALKLCDYIQIMLKYCKSLKSGLVMQNICLAEQIVETDVPVWNWRCQTGI